MANRLKDGGVEYIQIDGLVSSLCSKTNGRGIQAIDSIRMIGNMSYWIEYGASNFDQNVGDNGHI